MKRKILEITKKYWVVCLIIFLAVFLFWLPFIPKGMVEGWEIRFQYSRILTLIQSLQAGIFPGKLRPMHMMGYGYGVGFFYPDFFLYPPAFVSYLGVDPEISTKVFMFLVILGAAFLTYYLFWKLSGLKMAALMGVILFVGSRINYDNLILGSGFPHLYAYLFMPLAVIGLLHALNDEKKGYVEYGIGLAFVTLSHHLILVTMLVAMLIIVLCHVKILVKKPMVLIKVLGTSLLAMLLTTAYWLPAIEQASRIRLKALYDNGYDIRENVLSLKEIVFEHIGAPLFFLFVAAAIAYILMDVFGKTKKTDIWSVFATCCAILYVTCSKSLWMSSFGQIFGFFEYTKRFVFVMTCLMIIFIVMVLREVHETYGFKVLEDEMISSPAMIVCLTLLILFTRCDNKPDFYRLDNYSRNSYTFDLVDSDYNVSGGEFLPVECIPSECRMPEASLADDRSAVKGRKYNLCRSYEAELDLTREYYDVPYVYYYGYRAYVVDDDMNVINELRVEEAFDHNGLVRVFMPEDGAGYGRVLVTYKLTALQKVAYIISVITALAMIASLVYVMKKPQIIKR